VAFNYSVIVTIPSGDISINIILVFEYGADGL